MKEVSGRFSVDITFDRQCRGSIAGSRDDTALTSFNTVSCRRQTVAVSKLFMIIYSSYLYSTNYYNCYGIIVVVVVVVVDVDVVVVATLSINS